MYGQPSPPARRSGCLGILLGNPRIMGALVPLVMGYFTYMSSTREEVNPFTGEKVRVKLTPDQEVAMGSALPQFMSFGMNAASLMIPLSSNPALAEMVEDMLDDMPSPG